MVTRPGHSLPELVVALVFVAVAFAAIAAGTLLAYRSTVGAARRQHAVVLAAALLDSLLAAPELVAGHGTRDGIRTDWRATAAAGGAVVVVIATTDPGAAGLARLEGFWLPPAPSLTGSAAPAGDAEGPP